MSAAARATALPAADAAGDRHHGDVGVLDRAPRRRRLALTAHHVEHAGGQHVGGQLGEAQRRVRRELRRLQHDGVAGRQRRTELPGGHVQRVVPGADRGDHAERARGAPSRCSPPCTRPAALPSRKRPAAAKKRQLSRVRSISNSMIETGLPTFSRLDRLMFVDVLLDEVGPARWSASLRSRGVSRAQAGSAAVRPPHGVVDVGGVAGRHRGDDLPGGRGQRRRRWPRRVASRQLAADEVLVGHAHDSSPARP